MDAFDLALLTASFVTFFVVIDPIGVAPIFAALTDGSTPAHRRTMAVKSVAIATGVLIAFAYGGEWLLGALHISLDAFRAAGGVLLFLIALEMIFEKRTERREERADKMSHEDPTIAGTNEDISVFPMAIPMLAGPGAIASIMLFMSGDGGSVMGQAAIFLGLGANLLACLLIFLAVGPLMRLMGDTLAAMITRILGVILAALAAQFIFDGIRGALLGG
ncbi:MarC family protein [Hyphobacterium indicum]|uniref:MarC family protein n=1 Tax=Hyphobacterium indicum TaxID=2162714 RepID=UPI000D6563E6|nr:MarC family protein [Hyphobacterium indicum]